MPPPRAIAFIGRSSARLSTRGDGRLGGEQQTSFAMKTSLMIALTMAFVLGAGGALAAMNKACKTGQHPWCAPSRTLSTVRPPVETIRPSRPS